METLTFAVIASFVLAFGLVSGRIHRTVFTAPMIFAVFGVLVSNRIFNLIDVHIENKFIDTLAELTLILILFTDASSIDLKVLKKEHDIPIRLLTIGLMLTMVFGSLAAMLVFTNLSIWEAVVLAIILSPTDAALAQAILGNPRVPTRIKQALNIESGLNDGMALPFLLFFISIASVTEEAGTTAEWLKFATLQLTLGPLVGILVGYSGGRLVESGVRGGWMAETFEELSSLGWALLAFALAELIGGNGFMAAFCAGLTIGNTTTDVCHKLYEFAEAEGQLLMLLTFMAYGAAMVPWALDHTEPGMFLYGFLSLTVVRMIPVAISLIGMKLKPSTVLFLGWFGPRGVASILYGLIILEEGELNNREFIFATMVITVLMSIFAHGLTAMPGTRLYTRHFEKIPDKTQTMEMVPITEMRLHAAGQSWDEVPPT